MDSLRAAEGIGIAANQIGVPLAIAWVGREDGTFFEIANPAVLEKTEPVSLEEGCLVPDEWRADPAVCEGPGALPGPDRSRTRAGSRGPPGPRPPARDRPSRGDDLRGPPLAAQARAESASGCRSSRRNAPWKRPAGTSTRTTATTTEAGRGSAQPLPTGRGAGVPLLAQRVWAAAPCSVHGWSAGRRAVTVGVHPAADSSSNGPGPCESRPPVTTDDRNFRLSRDVLPRRVQAALTLDMDARTFAGDAELTLSVERPVRSIVLHAVELDVSQAEVQAGGSVRRARVQVRPVSETVVLDLDDEVPAGEARLILRWTGRFTEGLRGLYLAGQGRRDPVRGRGRAAALPLLRRARVQGALGDHGARATPNSSPCATGRRARDELEGPHAQGDVRRRPKSSPSYLVALVVGPLVGDAARRQADGVPVRTWASAEKRAWRGFGQEAALAALPRLQDYFGLPYALRQGGPGRHPGLRGRSDGERGPHHLPRGGAAARPGHRAAVGAEAGGGGGHPRARAPVVRQLGHDGLVGRPLAQRGVRHLDGLQDRRPLAAGLAGVARLRRAARRRRCTWTRSSPRTPSAARCANAGEAGESFDAITYEKGGAVLRMIEGFLGEDPFREGIRDVHAEARAGERGGG